MFQELRFVNNKTTDKFATNLTWMIKQLSDTFFVSNCNSVHISTKNLQLYTITVLLKSLTTFY